MISPMDSWPYAARPISSPRRHVRGHQQRRGRRQVAAHVLCPEAVGARGQGDATGGPASDASKKHGSDLGWSGMIWESPTWQWKNMPQLNGFFFAKIMGQSLLNGIYHRIYHLCMNLPSTRDDLVISGKARASVEGKSPPLPVRPLPGFNCNGWPPRKNRQLPRRRPILYMDRIWYMFHHVLRICLGGLNRNHLLFLRCFCHCIYSLQLPGGQLLSFFGALSGACYTPLHGRYRRPANRSGA